MAYAKRSISSYASRHARHFRVNESSGGWSGWWWRGGEAETGLGPFVISWRRPWLLSVHIRESVPRKPHGAIQTIHPEGTPTPVAAIILDVHVGIVGKRAYGSTPPILPRHHPPRRDHFVDRTREECIHARNPGLQTGRPLCMCGAGNSRQHKERKNSNSHRNLERREIFATTPTLCMIGKMRVNETALCINLS